MIGLIGKKIGMTQVFDEQGKLTPVTVLHFEPNVVVRQKNVEKDKYDAVVVGSVDKNESRATKPYKGQFPEGIQVKKHLEEFRDVEGEYKVGDSFGVELLEGLSYVDITGRTKGKGYQGVMRRHGFGGGRKTHGSKFHRANGSTGMAAAPSRVLKGTKMPGRMGFARHTTQNIRVVKVDTEKQIIMVRGAVPGVNNGIIVVRKAKKR
ncbi:MAG: 50S ribosomal protein L3 [Spirochaetia bacterium]